MAPTEQGVGTSSTRLETLLMRTGSSPRVVPVGQQYRRDELWPVEPLMLTSMVVVSRCSCTGCLGVAVQAVV